MTTAKLARFVLLPLCLCIAALQPALAEVEVRGPDGRRILLENNGTWRYLDAQAAAAAAPAPAEGASASAQDLAELRVLQRADIPGGCSFVLVLHNQLPYEIRSLVPEFAAHRVNGVAYASQGLGFGPVKPGDSHRRNLRFMGIACPDIVLLKVGGGDRCDMGDLNKFSEPNGQCLARVRVVAGDGVVFNK